MSFKLSNQGPTYALSSGGNLSSTLYNTEKERFQQSFKLLVCEGIFLESVNWLINQVINEC